MMICEDCGRETPFIAMLEDAPICSRCIKEYAAELPEGEEYFPRKIAVDFAPHWVVRNVKP